MAITSGFFDSMNDRYYHAEQFGAIFDGVISDGVFATVNNHLLVAPLTGMQVIVKSGKAWFDHTWTVNDADHAITVPTAHTVNPRIDTVVLEVNKSPEVRENRITLVEGSPAASPVRPALTHSEYINQYPLADIRVPANATTISAASITNRVGTSDCPWVAALMETIDASALYEQWAAAFNSFLSTSSTSFQEWFDALEEVFSETEYQNIMNRVASVARIRQGRFLASGWSETSSGSNIYSQTISVTGMSADYNPILVGMIDSNATVTSATAYNRAFSQLVQGRGESGNGTITWYCYGGKPSEDIEVGFKGE